MRHFDFLSSSERVRLFHREPQAFSARADVAILAVALGATLYSPATRPRLSADIAKRVGQGVMSSVLCLEDAIADEEVDAAERNVIAALRAYASTGAQSPLLFVRVRTPKQIPMIVAGLGDDIDVLSGFVLPKFTRANGGAYLDAVYDATLASGRRLLAMRCSNQPRSCTPRRACPSCWVFVICSISIAATFWPCVSAPRISRRRTACDVRVTFRCTTCEFWPMSLLTW